MSVFKDTLRLKGNKSQGTDVNTEDQKYCISPSKFREQGKWRQWLFPSQQTVPNDKETGLCGVHVLTPPLKKTSRLSHSVAC